MTKLRIIIVLTATMLSTGCSTMGDGLEAVGDVTEVIPNALDRTSLVYKPTIQQGNVVTQEQINELRPGMTKRQVRFLLGTPMLTDVFHANRWDYAFTLGVGSQPTDRRQVTVFFENDRLTRITGDLRPQPEEEREEVKPEVVVTVPDWEEPNKSLWRRAVELVGLDPYDD
jgi:outer membrane protein assembly factor BamE